MSKGRRGTFSGGLSLVFRRSIFMDGRGLEEQAGGQGHPLPDSQEAREDEIPEHLVREKGHGEDAHEASKPDGDAVAPDGEHYPSGR
jgi:hypothetical protein